MCHWENTTHVSIIWVFLRIGKYLWVDGGEDVPEHPHLAPCGLSSHMVCAVIHYDCGVRRLLVFRLGFGREFSNCRYTAFELLLRNL